jgi:hypothetical protein
MTQQQLVDTTMRTVRRATVGKTVLGWAALACLLLNGAFWAMLMLDILAPRSLLSPQGVQAGLALVAFALVLPLFWSMLLPSSPAGKLLQRQTWATPGYLATSCAAVFLTWMAGTWLRLWWAAQPNVVEARQDLFLTVTSLIAGVLVPALAWCVTTPEQWVSAIEQARQVRRLEHAMKMEEAAMRAAYARAVSLLHADLTNLTLAQRRELAGILGAFARTQQQALASIAASWKDMYNVECQLTTTPEPELLASYQQVAALLTESTDAMQTSAAYALQVAPVPERENADLVQVQSGPVADRPTGHDRPPDRPYERVQQVARQHLSGAWMRRELEQCLSVSKTQAHTYICAWVDCGDVERLTEPEDHYAWRNVP